MLRILGTRKNLCDSVQRRDFLQIGGLGVLGPQLHHLLASSAAASPARDVPGFGDAKSCILLFPYGSPSSHETFDPKPDAPVEIQGELGAIDSNVPGLQICERLPRVAKVMDRVTVIRSMTHQYPVHGVAYALTGIPTYTPELETRARDRRQWPFVGSIVDYLDEQRLATSDVDSIPRNVGLPWVLNGKTDNPAVNAGVFSAFLDTRHDPLWTDFDGPGLHIAPKSTVSQTKRFLNPYGGTTEAGRFHLSRDARLAEDVSLDRLRLRESLLSQFEQQRAFLDRSASVKTMNHQRQMAMSLLTSHKMRDALDIGRESLKLRQRYGMTLFGQACLAARRLVERGARFVTVFWDCFGQFANGGWDTHQYHYPRMKDLLLPGFDLAYSALLEDLVDRGLLDETLVVWMSEHGRTPKIYPKPGAGREHWSRAYSVALAGGGTAAGKVVGRTTRDGGEVAETPISPKDIQATMLHLLGIDPHATVPDQQNRPHPVAGTGQTRLELIG